MAFNLFKRKAKAQPVKETPKQIERGINQVLKDKKVREVCITNAQDIEKRMRGNWFTLDEMQRKTNFKQKEAAQDVLNLLCLFELCYRKVSFGATLKYKITFTPADRQLLLQEELRLAELEVSRIKRQMELISNK